jgi:hypothetical protein
MAKGLKTGGRVKGTPTKSTVEKLMAMADPGLQPKQFLTSVMRGEVTITNENSYAMGIRIDAAKALLPYDHARYGPMPAPLPEQKTIEGDVLEPVRFHKFEYLAPKRLTHDG